MPRFKVIYDAPFSRPEEIIYADDLDDAKHIAELGSVYRYFTVEEVFDEDEDD